MGRQLRYRAVLFDLDGTLVDSYAALADAVNFARGKFGLGSLTTETIREFVGEGLERLLCRAFYTDVVPAGATEAFEARYDAICCEQSRILDDVEDTLADLDRLGVSMAVCTNKPTAFSRKILEFLELAHFFCDIVGPDTAGARKPAAQHVLRTLEATHCSPDQALFVGDMPLDVTAAHNGGMAAAVVPTGTASSAALKAAKPEHYLDRLADLVQIVRNGARA
ncbi:MAG TPA: HAD-IA family hydrolase [Thermoanaerobaculia bacterium]|jgi:phosphoglycolate phosphatase